MSETIRAKKSSFLQNNLETISACDICHEPFSETHAPARIKGPKTCQHIFGMTCLRKWMNSGSKQSNTCPKCREVLFTQPVMPRILTSHPSADERTIMYNAWLEHLTATEDQLTFLRLLWKNLYGFHKDEKLFIYEEDIEACINKALWETAHERSAKHGLFIKAENFGKVTEVAIHMMATHYTNAEFLPLEADDHDETWAPMMKYALGWKKATPSTQNAQPEDSNQDTVSDTAVSFSFNPSPMYDPTSPGYNFTSPPSLSAPSYAPTSSPYHNWLPQAPDYAVASPQSDPTTPAPGH